MKLKHSWCLLGNNTSHNLKKSGLYAAFYEGTQRPANVNSPVEYAPELGVLLV